MNALIEGLLDYSRLGRKALSIQNVDMEHLARECLAALREEIACRLDTQITIEPLPSCRGDEILLKQAIFNLVSNALKYTTTMVRARIRTSAKLTGAEYMFCIEDNGVGFDMRYASKLFEVLQRLHPASNFPGAGVGLAIVRRAVERHGGRCWAHAEPGCGATFCFCLPADPGNE